MLGGRMLDKGLYGCVFVPDLKCRPGTVVSAISSKEGKEGKDAELDQLSKLIHVEDAEQEFMISKRIHRIPFYSQYFSVAEEICQPSKVQKEKDLEDCPAFNENKLSEMRLLRLPYQGKSLSMVTLHAEAFDLRAFVTHLVAGGALMNLFGVVHRDLHQGNVLVDLYNVPRIIDFNLSFAVSSSTPVKSSELSHVYMYEISQEPPDSTLVNAIAHKHSAMAVIHKICYQKRIIQQISTLLGVRKDDMFQQLMAFYRKSESVKTGDMAQWFHLYYRTIDSWAIGVIIVQLIFKLSVMKAFSSRIQDTVKALRPILRKMCAISPIDRIDCVQALHLLDPQHVVLRRFGKKWLDIVGKGV